MSEFNESDYFSINIIVEEPKRAVLGITRVQQNNKRRKTLCFVEYYHHT